MAHIIDKDALVAEIERRVKTNKECMLGLKNLDYYQGKVDALNETLSSIDTLELKEVGVDFGDPKGDKSAEYIIDTKTLEVKEANFEKELDRIWFDNKFGDMFDNSAVDFAHIRTICKHFFERGIAVSNKAQKGE